MDVSPLPGLWLRALAYMLAVGGIHYVALPWLVLRVQTAALRAAGATPRVRLRRRWPVALGVAFIVSGVGLAVTAAHALVSRGQGTPFPLDPTRHLVIDGPYRYVRNPQAVAACLIVAGEVLGIESRRLWLLLPLTVLYLEGLAAPLERRELVVRFGHQYVQYRQRVPAWVPVAISRQLSAVSLHRVPNSRCIGRLTSDI